MPLEVAFPAIYQLASKKDGSVKQYYVITNDKVDWHLHLRMNLNDWEIGEAITLMEALQTLKINIMEGKRV